jgi:hypothetical protein
MITDTPEVAAAIAARKRTLDLQSLVAAIGMAGVAVFFIYDAKNHDASVSALIGMLPWIIGLSIAIFLLNRWLLSIQSKLIRRQASSGLAKETAAGPRQSQRPAPSRKRS